MRIIRDVDHEVEINKTAKYKDGYLQSFLSKLLANRSREEVGDILSHIEQGHEITLNQATLIGLNTTNVNSNTETTKEYYTFTDKDGKPVGTIDGIREKVLTKEDLFLNVMDKNELIGRQLVLILLGATMGMLVCIGGMLALRLL